jgi:hypothetical protein
MVGILAGERDFSIFENLQIGCGASAVVFLMGAGVVASVA